MVVRTLQEIPSPWAQRVEKGVIVKTPRNNYLGSPGSRLAMMLRLAPAVASPALPAGEEGETACNPSVLAAIISASVSPPGAIYLPENKLQEALSNVADAAAPTTPDPGQRTPGQRDHLKTWEAVNVPASATQVSNISVIVIVVGR